MRAQRSSHLNQLEKDLPEGLLVDASWLEKRGIASNLRSYYVKKGWLEQPARGVYRRQRGSLSWQQAVISLQTLLLDVPQIVGGRTALELHGIAHYLAHETKTIHLYGRGKPPGWLNKLGLAQHFVYHNSEILFRNDPITRSLEGIAWNIKEGTGRNTTGLRGGGIDETAWRQWEWPLLLSGPERAYLEMLDELPHRESFHQADMFMQGAANFSPLRLQKLLADCASIKVKRLFFFFADRHNFAWRKYIDRDAVDLGRGKRMLVKGGRLDPSYLITVPEAFAGLSQPI